MRKLILLLVVVCAVLADSQEIKATLKRIDQSKFGKTLLDTVYLQLQSGDPLDTLISTLHDLEDRYHNEQKEDDAENQSFQETCNYDIASYDKDIAESNTQRIQLEAKLEGELYPRREILTGVEKQKEKEVAQYNADIASLDQSRAEEAEEFEQKVLEHNEATTIITECRRIFTENLQAPAGESVFIQKTKRVHPKAKLTNEGIALIQKHFSAAIKRTNKFQYRKSWGKIFKALATVATRAEQLANQGAVDRIVGLCDELLHQINESLDLERFAEDKRIEAYKKARNLLTISLNVANSDLANVQTELASTNNQIAQTEATLDNTNQRLENLTEAREDRHTQCEDAATEYKDNRSARDADRQVVSDTIGLVNQQLRGLKEQLALRLQAGDSFDY